MEKKDRKILEELRNDDEEDMKYPFVNIDIDKRKIKINK